jgi:hypothetical protein
VGPSECPERRDSRWVHDTSVVELRSVQIHHRATDDRRTNTSKRPNLSTAESIIALTSLSLLTSHLTPTASAEGNLSLISCAALAIVSGLISPKTSRAPSAANCKAVSRPIPL